MDRRDDNPAPILTTEDRPVSDLPRNRQAEQAVIGAALLSKTVLKELLDMIEPGDLYEISHEVIWGAIERLATRGKPVDAVSVTNELGRDVARLGREMGETSGPAYLHTCMESVPQRRERPYYAELLRGVRLRPSRGERRNAHRTDGADRDRGRPESRGTPRTSGHHGRGPTRLGRPDPAQHRPHPARLPNRRPADLAARRSRSRRTRNPDPARPRRHRRPVRTRHRGRRQGVGGRAPRSAVVRADQPLHRRGPATRNQEIPRVQGHAQAPFSPRRSSCARTSRPTSSPRPSRARSPRKPLSRNARMPRRRHPPPTAPGRC